MKSFKYILFTFLLIGISANLYSQKLFNPVYSFSKEKTAYITLNDGTQVQGTIQNVERKKGLILSFSGVDMEGNAFEYRAGDVKNMYALSSGTNNQGRLYDFISDATKWDNSDYNKELFADGYVYFEQAEVEMGRKTRMILMQLLNPSFSSKIKVYMDPFVSETTSVSNAELKRSGDSNISYFVKDGSRPAFQLNKASYPDNFIALFGECQSMVPLKDNAKWTQFEQHLYNFNSCK
jgi:hypothetical protein